MCLQLLLRMFYVTTVSVNVVAKLTSKPDELSIFRVGSRVTLRCGTDSGQPVSWRWTSLVPVTSTFYVNGELTSRARSLQWSVDTSGGPGRHDLVIASVQCSNAGRYACRDNNGASEEFVDVELVVAKDDPQCRHSRAGSNENDAVNLECTFPFCGGNVDADMTWIDGTRRAVGNTKSNVTKVLFSDDVPGYIAHSYIEMPAAAGHDDTLNQAPYTCTVDIYKHPASRHTTKKLNLSCRPTTQTLGLVHVEQPVRNIQITLPSSDCCRLGDEIVCSADGTGEVSYEWLDVDRNVTKSVGARLELEEVGTRRYECTARNVVSNVTHRVGLTVDVDVGFNVTVEHLNVDISRLFVVFLLSTCGSGGVFVVLLGIVLLWKCRQSHQRRSQNDDLKSYDVVRPKMPTPTALHVKEVGDPEEEMCDEYDEIHSNASLAPGGDDADGEPPIDKSTYEPLRAGVNDAEAPVPPPSDCADSRHQPDDNTDEQLVC